MRKIWQTISFMGLKDPYNISVNKREILLNQVFVLIFFAQLFTIISGFYRGWWDWPDLAWSPGNIIFPIQFYLLAWISLGIAANYFGRHNILRISTIIIGPLYVTATSITLGDAGYKHYFFIFTIILPILFFKAEQIYFIFTGIFLNLFAAVFVLYWYDHFQPLQKNIKVGGGYQAFILLLLLVTAACYYLFIGTHNAEQALLAEKDKSDKLLLNILPKKIANDLKRYGASKPVYIASATVMFTDFHGFTQIAESLSPEQLVNELDYCFSFFDKVMDKYNLEKLKTIGDSYMCAGGIPVSNSSHAADCVKAAQDILQFISKANQEKLKQDLTFWNIRIGIHTGPMVAGVIGQKKFAYDIWGDSVNMASRMESSGKIGTINISQATYLLIKDQFHCEYRGKIEVKNKGKIDMYMVKA